MPARRRELSVEDLVAGVRAGDRMILARAITLIESVRPAHRDKANAVIASILPFTGNATRLGISGVPGAGKSTFIEALGTTLCDRGHRIAVLAVDPSSDVSGGSILGDKTRMENLSRHPNALVRPSPCGGWHGGVARGTRDSILLCEAAGFDVIFVETVGVGQSETQVATMVDFFLLLVLTGAGDELQGMKRGTLELADALLVHKCDGPNVVAAQSARMQYESALHLLHPASPYWTPVVQTASSETGEGIEAIWDTVCRHRHQMTDSGALAEKRRKQSLQWMKQMVERLLLDGFYSNPAVAGRLPALRQAVLDGSISPFAAAESLIQSARDSREAAGGLEDL